MARLSCLDLSERTTSEQLNWVTSDQPITSTKSKSWGLSIELASASQVNLQENVRTGKAEVAVMTAAMTNNTKFCLNCMAMTVSWS